MERTYWSRMLTEVNRCGPTRCPRDVVDNISLITWEIFSGTCMCGEPAIQRPMTWFYDEIQSIMLGQDLHSELELPGGRNLAPRNSDLTAPDNAFCEGNKR
jgi:hypothetical protein